MGRGKPTPDREALGDVAQYFKVRSKWKGQKMKERVREAALDNTRYRCQDALTVGGSGPCEETYIDETYIKVKGRWTYL